MGPAAVGTAIGAATLTIGRGAVSAVGNGLSFLSQLANATANGVTETTQQAGSSLHSALKVRGEELRQRIQRQLAHVGIALTKPVQLVSNERGDIAVAGSHPQQAAIEEALASDVLLERDFHQLASDYRDCSDAGALADAPRNLVITLPQ